jgi:hypothetical protein
LYQEEESSSEEESDDDEESSEDESSDDEEEDEKMEVDAPVAATNGEPTCIFPFQTCGSLTR